MTFYPEIFKEDFLFRYAIFTLQIEVVLVIGSKTWLQQFKGSKNLMIKLHLFVSKISQNKKKNISVNTSK